MRAQKIECGPTEILTDNRANLLVGSGDGTATRSRHFLRRYFALHRRIKEGEAVLRFVSDVHNPADSLTKWLPRNKLNESIDYFENPRNAVE